MSPATTDTVTEADIEALACAAGVLTIRRSAASPNVIPLHSNRIDDAEPSPGAHLPGDGGGGVPDDVA